MKFLPVMDEYTRQALALEVDRSLTGDDVVAVLSYLFQVHGEPEYILITPGTDFGGTHAHWLACRTYR